MGVGRSGQLVWGRVKRALGMPSRNLLLLPHYPKNWPATKRKREGDEGEAAARTGATKKKAKKRKKKSRAARRAAKNAVGKDEERGGS